MNKEVYKKIGGFPDYEVIDKEYSTGRVYDYITVVAGNADRLNLIVQNLIRDGWIPTGYAKFKDGWTQLMTKRYEDN